MDEHAPLSRETGRQTPAQGVKISLAGPTIVLLTVNTKDRLRWLNQPKVQSSLDTIWRAADAWLVGYYLLMPDHLHLFCAPRNLAFTLEQWMSYWKSAVQPRASGRAVGLAAQRVPSSPAPRRRVSRQMELRARESHPQRIGDALRGLALPRPHP